MDTKQDFDMIREQAKQQYVEAVLLNAQASANGDFKTANRQAKRLKKIFHDMEEGRIDKSILVELLGHSQIRVRGLAAIDLLRARYETEKAVETLKEIAMLDESDLAIDERLGVFGAQIQLKNWIEKSYVSR